jgi:hypothetical protein
MKNQLDPETGSQFPTPSGVCVVIEYMLHV